MAHSFRSIWTVFRGLKLFSLSVSDPVRSPFRHGQGARVSVGFIVEQNAFCVAFEIIVLAVSERPEKGQKATEPQQKRDRDEEDENVHGRTFNRTALRTTRIDDEDIAAAAINGVAKPRRASGMLIAL